MPIIPFWLECTAGCGWRRAIVPTSPSTPENQEHDWRNAALRAGTRCPRCGDANVVAVERDAFNRVVREAV